MGAFVPASVNNSIMFLMDSSKPAATSLRARARKGVVWVGFVTVGSKLLSVATTLVLARILAPSDFGLIATANIVVAALAIFTDLGLGSAIIHSKADRKRMASTAFFLMPIIGLTLYAIAFVSAPLVAGLLGNEGATTLIRIVAFTLVISSLTIVPSVLLEKDMAFKRKVIPDLAPTLVYITVALVLAAIYKLGPYSIAFGVLAQSFAGLILNWLFARWRPSLLFDREIARDLIRYGKNVLGGSVIVYFATNMDNAFVSRATGSTGLGHYTLAYNVANLPATHIGDVLGRVLFPSFVELNDDFDRLKKTYVQALKVLIFVTFPVLAGIAALADPFVRLVLGEAWVGAIVALQILVIFTAFRVISGATGSLFLATARTSYILWSGVIGLTLQALLLTGLVALADLGLAGASMAVSIASALNALVIAYWVHRIFPYSAVRVGIAAIKLIMPAIIMGAAVYLAASVAPSDLAALVAGVLIGVVVYVPIFILLNGSSLLKQIKKLVTSRT